MRFTKMQGIGNDYVYVNCFEEQVTDPEEAAKAIAYIKSQPNVTMEEVRDYHG